MHTSNPSTSEAEVGGLPRIQGQPGLCSEFQASQGYTTNKHKGYQRYPMSKTFRSIMFHKESIFHM